MWVVPKVLWCLITCAIIKTVVKVQMFCSVPDPFKILPKRMLLLTIEDNYFWNSWLPPLHQYVSDTLVGNRDPVVNKADTDPSLGCVESSHTSIWASSVKPALSWEI